MRSKQGFRVPDTQVLITVPAQVRHPDRVTGRKSQEKVKVRFIAADEPVIAQATDDPGPAESCMLAISGASRMASKAAGFINSFTEQSSESRQIAHSHAHRHRR